ncbi:5232_t:CDS:2 [Rhizophagus irregularis]|nr:5232_t:CDS:2 [Rhizophagus irregularis]
MASKTTSNAQSDSQSLSQNITLDLEGMEFTLHISNCNVAINISKIKHLL